ncbi:MAG: T9SS type A sorting domain-containing protein [Bacteroidales bacterium]|nr:T9SS type A sorting domain-containing protein [Bacteroidales bacterium]
MYLEKDWPQGTYLMLVQTASGISTKKLIVRP